MKKVGKTYIRLRIIMVGCTFSLFFIVIGAKAVYLQIYCGSWLSQKAANQYEKSYQSCGKRGTIFDKNHREMAVSIETASVAAYPKQISDVKTAANRIAGALNINKGEINRKLTSKKSFTWIKRKVTPVEAKNVKSFKITGIDFIPEYSRFYPNKSLAAQVLGFSGIDGHGLEGIEYRYDTYLKGSIGEFTVLRDAYGRKFDGEKDIASNVDYTGKDIILTIDRTIQYIAEKALEEAVADYSAKSGLALVMKPKTGAILAMAHVPLFNPNSYNDFAIELWRNRSITDSFEPGSTMKIFNIAAAIELGVCTPNTLFFCENGKYRIGKNIIHDTTPRGWLSLEQVVRFSSNIGAVKVSEMIGPESLYNYLKNFGFGEKTGIDCPGEAAGSLAPYTRWAKIDAGAIAFGQGISVSAIQLLAATSAIANEGVLMKPFIVQAIMDQNGRLLKSFGTVKVRRVISARTARVVRKIMKSVVSNGGTGINAALEGYSACGKTGTAQKIDENGTYAKGKFVASFVGFAPVEKAEVAILVVIDEPLKHHYGGIVAAPVFKKIADETLNYINVPPKKKNGTDRIMVELADEAIG